MREPREVSAAMEKKQVQDSFLISFTELRMLPPNLAGHYKPHLIITAHWFHQYFKHECIQIHLIHKQGKKWVTHPSRCPFSISSLTMTYFLSIGQEKSFALAHLTINFLTREIYFPGNGKGQCILRKPWKIGHSLNNPCLSLSSVNIQIRKPHLINL